MPQPSSADQLRLINDLITEPLQELMEQKIEAGNGRLANSIDNLAGEIRRHIVQAEENRAEVAGRLAEIERDISSLKRFKTKIATIYAAIGAGLTMLGEWIFSKLTKK